MYHVCFRRSLLLILVLLSSACGDCSSSNDPSPGNPVEDMTADADLDMPLSDSPQDLPEDIDLGPIPESEQVYTLAGSCVTVEGVDPYDAALRGFLTQTSDERFAFSAASSAQASRIRMRASDLGTYLLFDAESHHVVVEERAVGDGGSRVGGAGEGAGGRQP